MPTDETSAPELLATGSSRATGAIGPGGLSALESARTGVWINIHADPHNGGLGTGVPIVVADTISNLLALLDSATEHGHRLTVLLSPPWTQYLLENAWDRSQLVWRLKAGGHLLGFHHHDVSHTGGTGWDGYHSLSQADCMSGTVGGQSYSHTYAECDGSMTWTAAGFILSLDTVEEAYAEFSELMNLLFETHEVDSGPYERGFAGSQGPADSIRNQEWQGGVVYSQVGVETLPVPVQCTSADYGGQRVLELGSMRLAVGNRNGTLIEPDDLVVELEKAVAAGVSGQYFGVSFHAWEYRATSRDTNLYPNDDEAIDKMFDALVNAVGLQAKPMQELMGDEDALLGCLPLTASASFP